MNGWLLDTNVLSELRKPHCTKAVRAWVEAQPPHTLFISVITLAEIRYGAERASTAELRQRLNLWLDGALRPWFAGRILPVDEEVILEWRRMVEAGRKKGHTFSQPDLFLAATAATHGLAVATRNVDDFHAAEIAVTNPWLAEG